MPQTLFSSPSAAWEWLDLVNPSPAELELLAEKHGLHPASVKDALQPEHLPKYEFFDEILFIITRLHDPKAHLEADTICIHGDGEHALEFAKAINEALSK